jgi:hypothetical protein
MHQNPNTRFLTVTAPYRRFRAVRVSKRNHS